MQQTFLKYLFTPIFGVVLFALQFDSTTLNAMGSEIKSQTLRYSVMYSKRDAGELEVIIENNNGQIKTTTISHLSTIAQIFLSPQTSETWFSLKDGVAFVDRGNLLNSKSQSITNGFEIDLERKKIVFQKGDPIAVESGDVFESTSFPIALMTSEIESVEGTTVREISPKRVRYYVYQKPEETSFELNGKTYEAWKVTRNKRGDPGRTVSFWLDRKTKIPLQIISSKKNKHTVMTLLNPK